MSLVGCFFLIATCTISNGFHLTYNREFHRTATKTIMGIDNPNNFDPRKAYADKNLIPKRTSTYLGPIRGDDMKTNIFDALQKLGNFNTLVTAIKATGLENKMSNRLTTLFAPTDDAFSKLPSGNVEALLNDIPSLTNLLLFHVHPGKLNCTRNARSFNTALKNEKGYPKQLSVKVASWTEEVFIMSGQQNIPKMTTRAIQCTNGLLNIMNEVLIPYDGDAPPMVTMMGARDVQGEATLQQGYYGAAAGTDRHGNKYTGPKQDYKPIPIDREVWAVAGNWFKDAAQSTVGMSSLELEEW